MKTVVKWMGGITIVVFILFLGTLGFLVATGEHSYIFALMLESRWSRAKPTTKTQLESYLHCYKTRQIAPSQSMWGRHYEIKPGERMLQYCILWDERCPLDVVYDDTDNIKAIFTSYE